MSQIVAYTGPTSQSDNQLRTQTSSRSAAYDPVDKLRVSQPQALIDTDFEYGQQPTKWESINLQNNRQGAYYIPQIYTNVLNNASNKGIQTTSASRTVTVFMADTTTYAVDTPIFIQGATNPNVNGWWLVNAVSASTSVSFLIDANATASTNVFNPGKTYVYPGYFYSNCGFQVGANCITGTTTTATCTTTYAHGLNVGDYIYVKGTNDVNANGSWIVATTPTASTFTFTTAVAIASPTNSAGQTTLYTRPAGWVESRPYDGGVAFSAGGTITNQQLIRQTRRYFRYQSGKGYPVFYWLCIMSNALPASADGFGYNGYGHYLCSAQSCGRHNNPSLWRNSIAVQRLIHYFDWWIYQDYIYLFDYRTQYAPNNASDW